MARLIAVSIDCRNEAARQTFEEVVSRRRDYLVTKGQGTGRRTCSCWGWMSHVLSRRLVIFVSC